MSKLDKKQQIKISCSCNDSSDTNVSSISDNMSDNMSYDETVGSNDSTPMDHIVATDETIDTQSSEMSDSTSPPDVIVPDEIKLTESEIESVVGVETEDGTLNSDEFSEVQRNSSSNKNWSPTETINQMTAQSTDVNANVFQVFINEMIRDKCWTEDDVNEFASSMQLMSRLMDSAKDDDSRVAMLLNPSYYNAIHSLLDKLDTINVMCVLGTGDKCNMISNPSQREIIKTQVQMIGKLVDVYTPIFVRMVLLLERLLKVLSEDKACNIDPAYLATIKTIKSRVVGSIFMRRLAKASSSEEQNQILRQMSNTHGSALIDSDVLSDDGSSTTLGTSAKEGFDSNGCQTVCWTGNDYIMIALVILIIGVIVYMAYTKK